MMQSAFNQIFFLLSTLFGLNTFFIAEQVNLSLNFDTRTGTIEYVDLKTSKQEEAQAKQNLQDIKKAEAFSMRFSQLKLLEKEFLKSGEQLNAKLTFSFGDKANVLKLFQFNKLQPGKMPATNQINYQLMAAEKLISSNGKSQKDMTTTVVWDKDINSITLSLTLKGGSSALTGGTVSVAQYWEE